MDPDQQDVSDIGFDFDSLMNHTISFPTFDEDDPFWKHDNPADEPWLPAVAETNGFHLEDAEPEIDLDPKLTSNGVTDCTCGQIFCYCDMSDIFMPTESSLAEPIDQISTGAGALDHYEAPLASEPALTELPGDTFGTKSPQEIHEQSKSMKKAQRHARRSKISKDAKKILEEHFSSTPYPDNTPLHSLHLATKLKPKVIRTWFSNSRSRKACNFILSECIGDWADYIQLRNLLRLSKVTESVCHQNA